jgi:hypothetical protein
MGGFVGLCFCGLWALMLVLEAVEAGYSGCWLGVAVQCGLLDVPGPPSHASTPAPNPPIALFWAQKSQSHPLPHPAALAAALLRGAGQPPVCGARHAPKLPNLLRVLV